MTENVKNEALEAVYHYTQTYLTAECPYCKVKNSLNLGDLNDYTAPDVEACECHGCGKKFWLPGCKENHQDMCGIIPGEDDCTPDELGLNPGDDLIEHAFCERGKE